MLYFVLLLGFSLFGKQQDSLNNMIKTVSAIEEDGFCAVSFSLFVNILFKKLVPNCYIFVI